jgi:hypothetical protein
VRQSRYRQPLALPGLDDHDLWDVIGHFCKKAGRQAPDRAETLSSLTAVDPQRRPLFAYFLADAVAAGRSPRGWDRETLLRDVLRREEESFWTPAGVAEQDKNLLALATMTGGLSLETLLSHDTGGLLPDVNTFDPLRHEAMTGRPAAIELAPLEPDILGEFFVLTHLSPQHMARRLDRLIRLSWEIAPASRAIFLVRAANDFPREPALMPLCGVASGTSKQRHWWAAAAVELIAIWGNAGQLDQARGLWDGLEALAEAYPDEVALS